MYRLIVPDGRLGGPWRRLAAGYAGLMTSASTPTSVSASTGSIGGADVEPAVLGLVAAFELSTFERLAADAAEAPDLRGQVLLTVAAAAAVERYQRLVSRLEEIGVAPFDAVAPFTDVLDDFDARTPPSTWWERLLRSYVGYGVADDFCRHLAAGLPAESRAVVLGVIDDATFGDIAAAEIARDCTTDEVLVSRLALWGRRLVGEALGVVQGLLADHPALALAAAPEAVPEGEHAPRLFGQLTAEHTRRMARLGLTA